MSKDIRKYHKPVTVITGLWEETDNVKELTRQLKTKIGTGGTYKEGAVILQGDHREAAKSILVASGFDERIIEVF